MQAGHLFLFVTLTFFWIWSFPLLLVAALFAMPAALIVLPTCLAISLACQMADRDRIYANSRLRQWLSRIPWYEWFPCQPLRFQEQSIIAVHPHGVLCCGAVCGIHLIPDANTVLCIASVVFYVPVIGWFVRLLGCIPATKECMQRALREGHSLLVVPGGVPEIVLAETGDDRRRFPRHGFLRLGHQPSVPVVAVFVRGECSTYRMLQGPFLETRVWLSWRLNVPLVVPLLRGHYGTWLPRRQPLTLVHRRVIPADKETYTKVLDSLQKT